jgi:hypothetical protein
LVARIVYDAKTRQKRPKYTPEEAAAARSRYQLKPVIDAIRGNSGAATISAITKSLISVEFGTDAYRRDFNLLCVYVDELINDGLVELDGEKVTVREGFTAYGITIKPREYRVRQFKVREDLR